MNRNKKKYLSIYTKSVIAFLGLGFVPLMIIGLVVFHKSISTVTATAIHNTQQQTREISDDTRALLDEVSELSTYLYEYEAADYGYFYSIMTNDSISDILKANLVRDALKKILYRNEYLLHIYFIDRNGTIYSTTRAPEKIVNQKIMREWGSQHFVPVKNAVSIIPTHAADYYHNASKESFTLTRNIMNTASMQSANQEILGTLYIDISSDYLDSIINDNQLDSPKQLMICDTNNDAIIYSNFSPAEALQNYQNIKTVFAQEDPRFSLKLDQAYYIGYRMDDTGWAVVEKLPLSNLERMYQTVVRTTVLLILASIALLFILYYFSSRTIAQPIRQLKHTMDQIKAGNLDARVDITTGDELGMLADGLNQMTEQLQQHIDKVYLSEIRQQEAELSALMTQIQPHYLYNTLDAIRMSSITHDDLDTARMLKSLSLQMRYLISDSRNLVTLKEELNSIRNYFIITQIKYEDQVQLEINADDNTLQCRIPRLSLQPIIENSVKYGIAPKGGGRIAIYAKEDQGNLLITILDDGVGMDPNMLDKANRILKGDLIQEKSGEEKYSIGLKNIEDRIKLQFGSLYGITIRSTPQLGTLVYVTLPMIDEEEV